MPALQVTRGVRLAFRALLASNFNTTLDAVCLEFGCQPFAIDFGAPGKNYFEAPLDIESLLEYQGPTLPAIALSGLGSENRHRVLGKPFSGPLTLQLSVFLHYPMPQEGDIIPEPIDFETLAEAVETTVYTILDSIPNDLADATLGDVSFHREPLVLARDGFVLALVFTIPFEI